VSLSGPGQATSDVGGQVSWLAGRRPVVLAFPVVRPGEPGQPSSDAASPEGAAGRTAVSPPTVAGTAAVFDRVPLTACRPCGRRRGAGQDDRAMAAGITNGLWDRLEDVDDILGAQPARALQKGAVVRAVLTGEADHLTKGVRD